MGSGISNPVGGGVGAGVVPPAPDSVPVAGSTPAEIGANEPSSDRLERSNGAVSRGGSPVAPTPGNALAPPNGAGRLSLSGRAGEGHRASDQASTRVSQAYVDAATEHSASRVLGEDGRTRITIRSELQDVQVDAEGGPLGEVRQGRLTLGTFERSIGEHLGELMGGFEPGDVVDLGPAPDGSPRRFTVSADPHDREMVMLRNALKQIMTQNVEARFGTTNKEAVFTSNTVTDRADGSFGALRFVDQGDGKFVLLPDPEPRVPQPGIDAWNVRQPERFGFTHGMFTTAFPDGAEQGWSHSGALAAAYYMGSVAIPDPKAPERVLRADIKGFSQPQLSANPEELQLDVNLGNGDAAGGRLNSTVTLRGREAIDFLTRVGVFEKGADGSYRVKTNTISDRASGGTRSYMTDRDILNWSGLRAIADAPILQALSAGGDQAVLLDALKRVHDRNGDQIFNYGNAGRGSSRTADEAQFVAIAEAWIGGWRQTVVAMRAEGKTDAEVTEALRHKISADLTDFDIGDDDYSRFVALIGSETMMRNITGFMTP